MAKQDTNTAEPKRLSKIERLQQQLEQAQKDLEAKNQAKIESALGQLRSAREQQQRITERIASIETSLVNLGYSGAELSGPADQSTVVTVAEDGSSVVTTVEDADAKAQAV